MIVVDKSLKELFGPEFPAQMTLPVRVYEDGEEHLQALVPPINPDYIFPKELTRDFNIWFKMSDGPLFLYGPSGTGKTEFVKQVAARLGVPLYRLVFNSETELSEIYGHYHLTPNGTEFRYGQAPLAAMNGGWLFLDEVSRAKPSTGVGMNGVLDKGHPPFVIPANGETIVPVTGVAGYRVFMADNTNLAGDETGIYNTANVQDVSMADRPDMTIRCSYPVKEERILVERELDALVDDQKLAYWLDQEGVTVETSQGPKTGSAITRSEFVDAICKARDMIRAQSVDGGNESAGALERSISARSLTRWVKYTIGFSGSANQGISALHYALARTLTNTCSPSTRHAIHTIVQGVFGVEEKLK